LGPPSGSHWRAAPRRSGFYAIGRRLFGKVPTPQKLMAHRPALMLGISALWTSIERFGTLDTRLRALVQLHVARLYDVAD
jgi:hypothetical protein